jgi:hypothetical protein
MWCISLTLSITGQESDVCPADGRHRLLASYRLRLLATMKATVGQPMSTSHSATSWPPGTDTCVAGKSLPTVVRRTPTIVDGLSLRWPAQMARLQPDRSTVAGDEGLG